LAALGVFNDEQPIACRQQQAHASSCKRIVTIGLKHEKRFVLRAIRRN
jgi:hypothetical protein